MRQIANIVRKGGGGGGGFKNGNDGLSPFPCPPPPLLIHLRARTRQCCEMNFHAQVHTFIHMCVTRALTYACVLAITLLCVMIVDEAGK